MTEMQLSMSTILANLAEWNASLSMTSAELRPLLLACVMMSSNCPKLLVPLVQNALADIASGALEISVEGGPSAAASSSPDQKTLQAQVHFIRRLREALFKGSVLCGGPYTINALGAVSMSLDPDLVAAVNHLGPVRTAKSRLAPQEYEDRGRVLFHQIYRHHADPVLERIGGSSPDLVQSILSDSYGRVLSDTTLLSIPESELAVAATLVPLNVPPQLKSHVYGSRNVGVPMEQVQQLVSVAETVTRWIRANPEKSAL
ncbi:hypothetical protein DFQ27_003455 [Actinomortierella ambigua]|uniref:Uncharacterized protein n=1 Tax=Actinomortierella ambigua TaxID=1343610 RepID=A0A9P6Q932_9FUNG|nr:hypothetical protein DFQ27_003455 [Actinomortierella ambigua]